MKKEMRAIGEARHNDIGQPREHFTIGELDSYHRRLLSPEEEAHVQDHIVFCRDCRQLLLDLIRFMKKDRRPGRVWSAEVAAAWEDWQEFRDKEEAQERRDKQEAETELEPAEVRE